MILSGWKEIAGYLHCSVRTIQRWEAQGLPVHRPMPGARSHVIAHSDELDRWVGCSGVQRLYPDVTVSIRHAKKLQGENQVRLLELQGNVVRLQYLVSELQARRRSPSAQATPASAIAELSDIGGLSQLVEN
jgi:hypothetical protein